MEPPADRPDEPGDTADDDPLDGATVDPAGVGVLPTERPRREPAHGAAASGVAAALALGLRHVHERPPGDSVGVELVAPDKPVDADRMEIRFDPGSSSGTVVVVRRPADDS